MARLWCWLFHWTKAGPGKVFIHYTDGAEVARHTCLRCLERITESLFPESRVHYSWGGPANEVSARNAPPETSRAGSTEGKEKG